MSKAASLSIYVNKILVNNVSHKERQTDSKKGGENMPNFEVSDTLVKLASLGASGVAIFAIFWIGWLLKSDTVNNVDKQGTIRCYIGFCCAIIVVLTVPTLLTNGNDSLKKDFEYKNNSLKKELEDYEKKLGDCKKKSQIYTVTGVVKKEPKGKTGDIVITIGYPSPTTPDDNGNIRFKVQKGIDNQLPSLGITAPNYNRIRVPLEDHTKPDSNKINIGTVTLNEF